MAGLRSGLNFIADRYGSPKGFFADRRPIRVVLIDWGWEPAHPAMVGVADYLFDDQQPMIVEQAANNDPSMRDLRLHGTACASILRCGAALSPWDQHFWNLVPFVDLRLATFYFADMRSDDAYVDDVMRFFLRSNRFDTADLVGCSSAFAAPGGVVKLMLDRLIDCAVRGRLQPGDVVVIPLNTRFPLSGEPGDEVEMPLSVYGPVAARIRQLAEYFGVTVVLPVGNSGVNLDSFAQDHRFVGFPMRRFHNRGVDCGAVLVGEDSRYPRAHRTNYGQCVDAVVGGLIQANGASSAGPDAAGDPGADPAPARPMTELEAHYQGTSSSAVFVAAILAAVQHVRTRVAGLPPLKPYEARAHLRQWRCPASSNVYGHQPPDAVAWLAGTGVIELTDEEWASLFEVTDPTSAPPMAGTIIQRS